MHTHIHTIKSGFLRISAPKVPPNLTTYWLAPSHSQTNRMPINSLLLILTAPNDARFFYCFRLHNLKLISHDFRLGNFSFCFYICGIECRFNFCLEKKGDDLLLYKRKIGRYLLKKFNKDWHWEPNFFLNKLLLFLPILFYTLRYHHRLESI